MTKQTFPECFHCNPQTPMWPVREEDMNSWIMDVCHAQAITEDLNRVLGQRKTVPSKKSRDMLAISSVVLNQLGGVQMAKAKKQSKTGLLDSLILKDIGSAEAGTGSYAEGALDRIITQVHNAFPRVSQRSLRSLGFSRRAVLSRNAAKQPEAVAA